jgi:hypothetical protein
MEVEFEVLQLMLAYQSCILDMGELEPKPYFQK